METWKPVVGYEDLYEVSSAGRLRRVGGRILKPNRLRNGYVQAVLFRNKQKTKVNMHRLVAFAFLDKPNGKDIVGHINNNPSDNRVENLEWCTQSENIKYCYDCGRGNNVARKRIRCVEANREFYSSMEAAVWLNGREFHDSKNVKTISRTIRQAAHRNGGRAQAYGYKWEFCGSEGSTTIPSGSRGNPKWQPPQ